MKWKTQDFIFCIWVWRNIVEDYNLLEYDAVCIDKGLGEDYVSTHPESRQIPISEDGNKSTHNQALKYIYYHTQNCISMVPYKNIADCSKRSLKIRALLSVIVVTRWPCWLRHCATSREGGFASLFPDGFIGIFH
jgi:hypothetical protein